MAELLKFSRLAGNQGRGTRQRAEVEIWPFCACTVPVAVIIGAVRSLWTWLWGRYHVPQNAFLVVRILEEKWSLCIFNPSLL